MPGLDIPGLDTVKQAEGHGCTARRVQAAAELSPAHTQTWQSEGPVGLAVTIQARVPALL